jgi:hypothetical protein
MTLGEEYFTLVSIHDCFESTKRITQFTKGTGNLGNVTFPFLVNYLPNFVE